MKITEKYKILLLSVLSVMLILMQVQLPVSAAEWYIYDFADILTDDEENALNSRAADITDRYDCGVYVITVQDYTEYGDDVFDVADATYQYNKLGYGEDRNGVLLYLSMEDRSYSTYFFGPVADYAFDDYGQEQMEKPFLEFLRNNDWYGGFSQYEDTCEKYLLEAAYGNPVRKSPVPALALCLGISCLISIIICEVLRRKSISVKKAQTAGSYMSATLNMTARSDMFVHATETREIIERSSSSSSSGSTSHHSSSGGSGRSGHF